MPCPVANDSVAASSSRAAPAAALSSNSSTGDAAEATAQQNYASFAANVSFAPSSITSATLLPPTFSVLSARSRWKSKSQFSSTWTVNSPANVHPGVLPSVSSGPNTHPSEMTMNAVESTSIAQFSVPEAIPVSVPLSQSSTSSTSSVVEASITAPSTDLNEFRLYKPLDTALHSQYLHQEELETAATEVEVAHKQKGVKELAAGELPFGFFDDAEKDAAARGVEGPTKKQQREIEFQGVKVDSLLDVTIERESRVQNIKDQQQYEYEEEEQRGRQQELVKKLKYLKTRKRERDGKLHGPGQPSSSGAEPREENSGKQRNDSCASTAKTEAITEAKNEAGNVVVDANSSSNTSDKQGCHSSGSSVVLADGQRGNDGRCPTAVALPSSSHTDASNPAASPFCIRQSPDIAAKLRAALSVKEEKKTALLATDWNETQRTESIESSESNLSKRCRNEKSNKWEPEAEEDNGNDSLSDNDDDTTELLIDWRCKTF